MLVNLYRFCIYATIVNIAAGITCEKPSQVENGSSLKKNKCSWPETGLFLNTSTQQEIPLAEIAASQFEGGAEICLYGDTLDISSMKLAKIPPLTYFTPCFPEEENLTLLSLGFNSISILPQDFFHHLNNLKSISLNTNKITTIFKGVFNDHKTLQFVDLAHNEIFYIANGAFNLMSNLRILILSDNQLKEFNNFWFHNTNNLTRLVFSFNYIKTLPDEAFKSILNPEDAQEISFNDNKIRNLTSKTLKGINKIGLLALQGNEIGTWKNDFLKDGPHVNILRVHDNSND